MASPFCYYYCSGLAQTHHNSVHRILINEMLEKLWRVLYFTTSLLLPMISSFANAILTTHMEVAQIIPLMTNIDPSMTKMCRVHKCCHGHQL